MLISLEFLSSLPLFETEKPYEVFMHEIPNGLPKTNCEYTKHDDILVNDVRSIEKAFTLEECGFCFLLADRFPAPTTEDFESNSGTDVVLRYLRDTVSFVLEHVHAERALCFDWRVR
jgi:hypothetical protein